ncbi:MAG: PAM68 family protein, partial [Phormidesmis sp.]
SGAIPEAVSQRMLRRMAVLSGAPVFLGVGIFFLAYYLQSRQIVEFPPVAVLLVTMGCFGLGVLGLTYGVLSASWDPEPGGLAGLKEFKLNVGRLMEARRSPKT